MEVTTIRVSGSKSVVAFAISLKAKSSAESGDSGIAQALLLVCVLSYASKLFGIPSIKDVMKPDCA
jgi:hypothetical protein